MKYVHGWVCIHCPSYSIVLLVLCKSTIKCNHKKGRERRVMRCVLQQLSNAFLELLSNPRATNSMAVAAWYSLEFQWYSVLHTWLAVSYSICYKYRLSNQHLYENTTKNICFYSQRYSRHFIFQTQLEQHLKDLLNESQAERMMGSMIEAHISSFWPYICTPAWLGDQTPTPRLRTSGIHSLCYQHSSLQLHSPIIPGILPTAKNCYMNREDCPPDIKHFSLTTQSRFTPVVTIPFHSTFPHDTYIYK